jgi:hypothetical protein
VSVAGFGKFSKKAKPARMARNPKTGEQVKVAASNAVKFTVAKAFKEALNSFNFYIVKNINKIKSIKKRETFGFALLLFSLTSCQLKIPFCRFCTLPHKPGFC